MTETRQKKNRILINLIEDEYLNLILYKLYVFNTFQDNVLVLYSIIYLTVLQ